MSKYLNLFKTKAEANATVYDENNTPNVSYCEEDDSVKYTKKIIPTLPVWMEMVDLGLPSGLKWAKANVGAIKESDVGLYFQWGDIVGYPDASHSTWDTCPFNNNKSSFDNTYWNDNKNNFINNDILKSEYDAAYIKSNGKYRMPTNNDIEELFAYTNYEFLDYESIDNNSWYKYCGKFTSKVDPNKYIIIPRGYVSQNNIYKNYSCGFWSSNLHQYNYGSFMFCSVLNNIEFEPYGIDKGLRYRGLHIRAVCN